MFALYTIPYYSMGRNDGVTKNALVILQIILTELQVPGTIAGVCATFPILLLPLKVFQLSLMHQDSKIPFYIGVCVTKLGIGFGYQQLLEPIENVQPTSEAGLE